MNLTTEQRLVDALRDLTNNVGANQTWDKRQRALDALAAYDAQQCAHCADSDETCGREACAVRAQQTATKGAWREDADVTATFDDGRKETVIELTNDDHSETYGYALPEHAARIIQCVNAHDGIVAALRACVAREGDYLAVADDALAAAGVQS